MAQLNAMKFLASKDRPAPRKQFFFEKKNQKTFVCCPRRRFLAGFFWNAPNSFNGFIY
jgi:hypothetical protein